ncbi:TetR/AcrR family transcriptional regulator [Streptomyces sp. HSW2009]|uniref:TetR/AcrR family transcriptional regulator n=1 Tax=Streptomyces sp. HSW2009 TaxID=3142890 RepID=UPI0032EAF307
MKPTRARILEAAERLLRTIGLARTTTKEIARAAGCSEAALYKHFRNKEDIFVHVLEERLPRLGPLLAELTEHPQERDVVDNLAEIVRRAAEFYASSVPIVAALYAEPTLLQRHNEGLREIDAGPRRPLEGLAAYLRTERAAGRIRPDADCDSAAALLIGACCQRAFLLSTDENEPPLEEWAADLARCVLRGLN